MERHIEKNYSSIKKQIRYRVIMVFAGIFALLTIMQLIKIQLFESAEISKEVNAQRTVTEIIPAERGKILDRNGNILAYNVRLAKLTFQPKIIANKLIKAKSLDINNPDPVEYLTRMSGVIANMLAKNTTDYSNILYKIQKKVFSNTDFAYLTKTPVQLDLATKIANQFPEVGVEKVNVRLYPNGSVAANLIGDVQWNNHGLDGIEAAYDSYLAGRDGIRTFDRGSDGTIITESIRNVHPAIVGQDIKLTIDVDLQLYVQQQLEKAKILSQAKHIAAVILNAKTAEILAMANDNVFNPGSDNNDNKSRNNISVTTPFEPGSVQKLVTAATAIELNKTKIDEIFAVPDKINLANVVVSDAWPHGLIHLTTTGIFGKSSNVGTLMLAKRIGPLKYYQMLKKFGLGQLTGAGLPGESKGVVPEINHWTSGTFANLPIGQGLSVNLLQLADMYQAIANDGLRIPPTIIKKDSIIMSTKTVPVQVVSANTAKLVKNMFRAVIQADPTGIQQGTGSKASIPGYQISGKTGTAQQVDNNCGCYSNEKYTITFAGFAPTNDPSYVIALMIDAPIRSTDGGVGQSAAPLFRDLMTWLLVRDKTPLSPPAPRLTLQIN